MDLKLELVAVPVSDTDRATAFYTGSLRGLQLVVSDIEQVRAEFERRGLSAGEVQELPWGRFVFIDDPDGNGWAVQQVVRG